MSTYFTVANYVSEVRTMLADLVGPPYRYSDDNIIATLNTAVGEISRVRPDIFLDLKYQNRLFKGDLGDGVPGLFTSASQTDTVPVPRAYYQPTLWYMSGLLQFHDTEDTQDVRAQMFHQKFIGALVSLAA